MEQITLTREELLELARVVTFRLDDRLVPYSREDLRAMAWIEGFMFAKLHQQKSLPNLRIPSYRLSAVQ
jgi:hypothetical protein